MNNFKKIIKNYSKIKKIKKYLLMKKVILYIRINIG